MRIMTACASALALALSVPALSQGQGNDHGNGNGGGPKAERGHGNGNSARGNSGRDNGNSGNASRGRSDRGNGNGNANAQRGGGNDRHADRGNSGRESSGRGNGGRDQGQARGNDRDHHSADSRGNSRNDGRRASADPRDFVQQRTRNLRDAAERAAGRQRLVELRDRNPDRRSNSRRSDYANDFYRERRWTDSAYRDRILRVSDRQRTSWQGRFCPPGLADKNRLCLPPGQYRKLYEYGGRFDRTGYSVPDWYRASYSSVPFYGSSDQGFDYRYADGYAYRVDPQTQLVAALLPVLGGALGLGQTLPTGYNVYNLPMQYRSAYRDDDYNYRYGDGAIYRVDPSDRSILGISELLTPGFTVGQPLPAGYGVYNVPYGYRDTYADSDEYHYRYNNGRIYQVDPQTQLVRAAIDLLV